MATETALSRLRDSLSQLGQLDFRSERSQTSVDLDGWPTSPQPRQTRPASPGPSIRPIGSPNPRSLQPQPFLSPVTSQPALSSSLDKLDRPTVALTKALRSSQERCTQLDQKRSEMQEELRIIDDDKQRFQLALGRQEQENKQLLQDRQKKMEETIHLRQELRIATDRLADIEAQTREKMNDHEAQRNRLERLVDEQRRHIETLESTNARESKEANQSRDTIERLARGMWALLEEKTRSLEFMTNLVSSLQSLFYNPTPFIDRSRRVRKSFGSHTQKRQEVREGVAELRELLEQIEDEIADSSQSYSTFIQRLLQREDEMKRIVAVKPLSILQQIQMADQLLQAEEKKRNNDEDDLAFAFHPKTRGKSSKKNRGSTSSTALGDRSTIADGTEQPAAPKRSRPSSFYVDWQAEMEQFKLITAVMETKFNQLTKLKKIIQVKQPIPTRKDKQLGKSFCDSAPARSRSLSRTYNSG